MSERKLNVRQIRKHLKCPQAEFAGLLGVSLRTLQEWEQGRRKPSGAARTLLKIAEYEPGILSDVWEK